ncbi:hypothetical protein [Streptomyces sp. NPDC056358]|uniref:hypothetical protein n=1 Tax=Streptomyces sp. NPDC056358 TaxID=3345794 RepID=UPI0035DA1704
MLHGVFSDGFDEIAAPLTRTADTTHQFASLGRRCVRAGRQTAASNRPSPRCAEETGDIQWLLAVLDPQLVRHSDSRGTVSASKRPVYGADKVSRLVGLLADRFLTPDSSSPSPRSMPPDGQRGAGVAYHQRRRAVRCEW